MKFKRVTQERYYEMLEVLPPAKMTGFGFLVGEAWTHRPCAVTGRMLPAFAAFAEWPRDRFFESEGPMTIPEFAALDPGTLEAA
jgi:hypothetical protein